MPKHPHHFAFLAILLGLLSLGTTLITEVSVKAVDNTGTLTTVSSDTSSSTDVTKTTTSTTIITDENKTETEPIPDTDSDNETETIEAVACSYTYSAWSACSTSGTQTRSVISKTPSGCYSSADPILKQSCTYVPPTEQKIACAYTLSDWSVCSTSGTQNRNILSRTPAGCYDSDIPKLQRTCVYSSPVISDSSGSVKTDTNATAPDSGVTPPFIFLNINGGEVISDAVKIQGAVSNAQNVEFYLVPVDSNISKYLGLAQKLDGNVWEYYFDSKKQPNGSYYLKAKIKNAYGTYDGGQRMLIVLNAGENPPYPEDQNVANTDNQPSSEWQKKYFKSANCVDKNICGGMADPDKDGMNNNDEYRYGTDPTNPDSDGDGFLDGDEIANGYNPLKPSPGDKSDKIVFESPKEKGEIKKDFYQVNSVELVQSAVGNKKLKISGKGIPNSFVTIYIYSDPIILTVKTDKDGNWSYEIDKDVEDGEHQIFVAVTDNTGKITAKSEPLAFVKTAEAVTVIPPAEAAASQKSSSPAKNQAKKDLFFFLALVIGGLALALASIGLYRHNAYKKEISDNIN